MAKEVVMSDVGLFGTFSLCHDVMTASRMKWERHIGTGMSGYVALVHHCHDAYRKRAMKIFDRQMQRDQGKDEAFFDWVFLREVSILQHVKHDFIVSGIEAFISHDHRAIVMPYYAGGTLAVRLPEFTTEMTRKCFLQLSSAVFYLNHRLIVHRDIKPKNVLFDVHGDVKLIDFGLSYVLTKELTNRIAGSKGYKPPEVESNTPLNYYKCDSYALGVTLWNMVFKTTETPSPECPHCLCPSKQMPALFSLLIQNLCHHDMACRWSVQCMVGNDLQNQELDKFLDQMTWI